MVNNMKEKVDLRIEKTELALQASLLNLLKENSFNKITVNDICQKANINRITFYNHYKDKYDLFDSLIKRFKDDLTNTINKNFKQDITLINVEKKVRALIAICLEKCLKYQDVILILSNEDSNPLVEYIIYTSLELIAKEVIIDLKLNQYKNFSLDLISTYIVGGLTATILYWLRNQSTYSRLQLTNFIDEQLSMIYKHYRKE